MGLPVWVTVVVSRLVGGFVTVIAHALLTSRQSAMSLTLMTTATPLAGLGLSVLGIAVTAWMIQPSSVGGSGSGRGPHYDLYSRARQTSLDEPPEL